MVMPNIHVNKALFICIILPLNPYLSKRRFELIVHKSETQIVFFFIFNIFKSLTSISRKLAEVRCETKYLKLIQLTLLLSCHK